MARISDHFFAPLYMRIFEQDPPCMYQETMEALLNIEDWYASPKVTFISMYNAKKYPHVLSRFAMDNLAMQDVSYHISTGLSVGLDRKKKEPWPTLPMKIRLYVIESLKEADVKV